MSNAIAALTDRRARRSRAAILAAFRALLIDERNPSITIAALVERADVGRSTFYQHFRNLDDLATTSMRPLADALAAACVAADEALLARVLDHFWAQRRLVRVMIGGPLSIQLDAVLSDAFDAALTAAHGPGRDRTAERARALYLGSGTASVLLEWLSGRISLSAASLSDIVRLPRPD